MKKTIMIVAAIAMTATMAQALVNYDTAGAGNWTDSGVWPGDVQPGTNDQARLKHDVTLDSAVGDIGAVQTGRGAESTLTIDAGGALTTLYGSATIGGNNVGHVVMNAGSLSVLGGYGMNIGTKAGSPNSSVTVNAGLLTIDAQLKVGATDAALLTVNGGTVTAGGIFSVNVGSTANLLGGSVSASSLSFQSALDTLNIQNDALLFLSGNGVSNINANVSSGNIVWSNGLGAAGVGDQTWDNGSGSYLHAAFDGTDTMVWVNQTIPEPATLGLIGFIGAATLIIRRRFLI